MTEATAGAEASAGAQLRAARERRGLHIAALAASMKVPQRKLEALEADRYDELPDLTFTRALAQSVCRALKIDPQPVLDRLPEAGDAERLSQVGAGINAPFRDRPGREDPREWTLWRKPVFWITVLVLGAAAVLALLPEQWLASRTAELAAPPTSVPQASTPLDASASAAVAQPAASESSPAATVPAPAASTATAGPAVPLLALRASAPSWVEVQDGNGQLLLSRHVGAGETVALEGSTPLRVVIGNAQGTQLEFRGRAVDLTPNTRDNVARLQLD
jgi:cytoskeleton protein RodZ